MDGDAVWAASGPNAIKYVRGKEVRARMLGFQLETNGFQGLSLFGPSWGTSRIPSDIRATIARSHRGWTTASCVGYSGRRLVTADEFIVATLLLIFAWCRT